MFFMYILFFLKQACEGARWFQPSCATSRWHCLAFFLSSYFRLWFKYSMLVAANVTCSVTHSFICFSGACVFVLVIILYENKIASVWRMQLCHTYRWNNWLLSMCSLEFTSCFGFSAGQYTCKDGKNRSCLVYVGFNHKIYVYYKVELERMESTNLLKVLEEKSEFKGHLKELGVGKCTGNSWKRSFRSDWSILNHVQSGISCFCCCDWLRGQLWLFVVNNPSGC